MATNPLWQVLLDLIDANERVEDTRSNHRIAKGVGVKVDFSLFGAHAVALLLRYGEVEVVRSRCLPQLVRGCRPHPRPECL